MTSTVVLRVVPRTIRISLGFRGPILLSRSPWQACRKSHKDSGTPRNSQQGPRNPGGSPEFPYSIRQPTANLQLPATKETFLQKTKKFLGSLELRRRLGGEASVPYGFQRVMRMKASDKQPVTADLVYTYSREGLVKSCAAVSTIVFIVTTAMVGWWYFDSEFEIKKAPHLNDYFKNPMRFSSAAEYGCAYLFALLLFTSVTLMSRRVPLRIYFDKTKDTFSIISINVFGGRVRTKVKAGMVKQRKSGFPSYFFGDLELLDEEGARQRSIRLNSSGFLTPWYYNHLTGSDGDGYYTPDGPYSAMFETDHAAKITPEDREIGEDFVAEKIARLNAEKLEAVRRIGR